MNIYRIYSFTMRKYCALYSYMLHIGIKHMNTFTNENDSWSDLHLGEIFS